DHASGAPSARRALAPRRSFAAAPHRAATPLERTNARAARDPKAACRATSRATPWRARPLGSRLARASHDPNMGISRSGQALPGLDRLLRNRQSFDHACDTRSGAPHPYLNAIVPQVTNMTFSLDATHRAIRDTARAFAREQIAPSARAWDEEGR